VAPGNTFISAVYVAWSMRRVACIILAVCFALNCLAMTGTTAQVGTPPEPSAYIPRAPIRIDNNTCFNATNGVTSGDGSQANPWIIENFAINGTGGGSCIYIGNTTEHFIVRNCALYNASGGDHLYNFDASLNIYNVTNGALHNNTVNSSSFGICLYNSFNNTIAKNNASCNKNSGILLDIGSDGNDIDNNTMSHNDFHGIYIYSGTGNLLADNRVYNNSKYGIYLYTAQNTQIVNCSVQNNTDAGIYLYLNSNYNNVTCCRMTNSACGVRISASSNNSVYHNDFINNTIQAIDSGIGNLWDDGYPFGGNYWNDYTGNDVMNGPGQNIPGSDGIGDTPYTNIAGGAGAIDSYPLMLPFGTPPATDTVPPAAISWGPTGNATQPGTIFIRWSESMDWTSVEEAFRYSDGALNYTSANGTWAHDLAFNSTFTPAEPLKYETAYIITVNCTARDFAGNYMDQDGNGTGGQWPSDVLTWNFTTTDRSPYVISTVPADGQVDVDPNKPLKIIFSERMNVSSVEAAFSFTNGTGILNGSHGLVYWNVGRTEFTFSPAEPLGRNLTYTAGLDGALARDYGGKTLEGGNYSWSFRTWLEPPAPHVIDTYPPAGATNVNVNTYINIAFDTEMDPTSLGDAFSYTDGTDVWDIGNGTYDWYSDNTLFSFQPAERLRFDSTYTVRITANATSIYGKPLDGNDNGIPDNPDDFVFMFATSLEPPTVVSHYPRLNQMDIPVSLSAIYINFSKIMLVSSVSNAISIYPATAFTPSFSGGGMNLTLVLASELLQGTEYRVTVLGTARDMDGTALDGNSDGWAGDKFVFVFFTEGVEIPVMPKIIRVWPAKNTSIPANSEGFYVAITFNVVMNKTSVEQAFSFTNGSQRLNGTFTWSEGGTAFRFMPEEILAYNTTYTCTVQGSGKDEHGNTLVNTTTWHYTTENAESTSDWMDWIIYGVVAFLIAMVAILYMANRSLRRDLKRTRVKLKRLKREMGIAEEQETSVSGAGAASAPEPEDDPPEHAAEPAPDDIPQPEEENLED